MTSVSTLTFPAPRHPPSEGAHRLAWWLGARGADGFEWLSGFEPLSFDLVDRLLSGEVEPSESVAEVIALATDGAVRSDDWARCGPPGWFDMPFGRAGQQENLCR